MINNFFVQNVLTSEECKLLIERGLQTDLQIMHSSKIVNGKVVNQDILKLDDNKRKGSYYFEDDMKEPIFIPRFFKYVFCFKKKTTFFIISFRSSKSINLGKNSILGIFKICEI